MVEIILRYFLLWSMEAAVVIGIAALCLHFLRQRPGNVRAAVLSVAAISIWLIPLSPYLIQPITRQPIIQQSIESLRTGAAHLFSFYNSSENKREKIDFAPIPVKTTDGARKTKTVNRPNINPNRILMLTGGEKDKRYSERVYSAITLFLKQNHNLPSILIGGIWCIGFLIFFIRWVNSWRCVSQITASAQDIKDPQLIELIERSRQLLFIHKNITVKQTQYPVAPFVKGIRRPLLILPVSLIEGTKQSHLKAIVVHELAHLRRYDLEIHQLIRLLKMVFWFLPPIWWLQRELYNTQDIASDECAAVVLGNGEEIGEALTHLAEFYLIQNAIYSTTGFLENKKFLLQRLENILSAPIDRLTCIPLFFYFLFAFFSLFFILGSGLIGLAILSPSADAVMTANIDANSSPRNSARNTMDKVLHLPNESADSSAAANNSLQFTPTLSFASQFDASLSMDIGDISGDGFADIMMGTDVGEVKSVFINQAEQALNPGQVIFGRRDKFTSIAMADLDRDGDLDIVAGEYFKPNRIFINDGKGFFTQGSLLGEANSFTQHIKVGDLNGDGWPDVAQYNRDKPCKIFWNDGQGKFLSETTITQRSYNYASFELLDWDRDGDLDLVIAPNSENTVFVYENLGAGQFFEHRKQFPIDKNYQSPKAVTESLFKNTKNNLCVFSFERNVGSIYCDEEDSTLVPRVQFPQTLFPAFRDEIVMDTGDVDADGNVDFILGNDQTPVQLYLNDGKGQIAPPLSIGAGGVKTNDIRFADMDADGDLDIVTVNAGSPGLIYRNDMPVQVFATPSKNEILTTAPSGVFFRFSHFMKFCNSTNCIVAGSQSGKRTGRYIQEDAKTYRFVPDRPFHPGETVQTILTKDTASTTGERLVKPYKGSFTTASNPGMGNFDSDQRAFGPVYNRIRNVVLGDMNGNGTLDIVTGSDENGCQVYFNEGQGRIGAARAISQTKEDTLSLTVSDIDGDGDLDVLAGASDRYPNKVYLNNGKGEFPDAVMFWESHGHSNAVAAGDINGDGLDDLVFANNIASEGDHRVYLNKGQSSFRESYSLGDGLVTIRAFTFADLDGDYDQDLVTMGWGGSNYFIPNNGDGDFRMGMRWLCSSSGASLCVGDFDSDRDIDLVCQRHYERDQPLYADILLLRNRGNGEFDSKQLLELDGKENDIQAGDIDGDGDLDILVISANQGAELTLLRNNGSGDFTRNILVDRANPYPSRLALGDMDGDGRLDIVVGRYGGQNAIYFNRDATAKVARE